MGRPKGRDDDGAEDRAGDEAALTFEQAMERIEAIIERIESGRSGLEESIREYETGARLLRRCREILAAAEQRVTAIDRAALESDAPPADLSPRADPSAE